MISYKIFAFSFFSLILFCNCSDPKDPCEETKHYYFFVKPEEKAVLPYKGFDTLKFKHSSGAEYTFYAGAIDSLFTITAKATSPDCANNIIEHKEYFLLQFKTPNQSKKIDVSLGLAGYSTTTTILGINFNSVFFNVIPSLYMPAPPSNYYDYDSLMINNYMYYNIRIIYKNNEDKNNKLYYNKAFGILKMSFANGETWERIP